MPIGFSKFNQAHCGLGYPKVISNLSLRAIRFSNCFGLIIREFSIRATFSILIGLSFLCDHIRKIIGAGPKPKMIWIDTAWHITRMANEKTVWDWSPMSDPSRSVGSQPLSTKAEHAISILDFISIPQDAAIWLWLRVKGQFLGKRNLARRETVSTFWFSQDRLRSAITVTVGNGVCALFRPANYNTSQCAF